MARRTKEDALKTRQRILAEALELFTQEGYENTTFEDIARRLEMSKGAVYWHFETKEKLLLAMIEEMVKLFSHQIQEGLPLKELSFKDVQKILISSAQKTVSCPTRCAYFLLLHRQIKWNDVSMMNVREELLRRKHVGPWEILRQAVENGLERGEIKKGTNPRTVADVCVNVWDGVLGGVILKFIPRACLEEHLQFGFDSVWNQIKI